MSTIAAVLLQYIPFFNKIGTVHIMVTEYSSSRNSSCYLLLLVRSRITIAAEARHAAHKSESS